ncbi:unnamed protein product, partial [Rotaria sp. Silwood2]
IEDHIPNCTPSAPTNLDCVIQEHREEQEVASHMQTNQTISDTVKQKEEEDYGALDYLDDYKSNEHYDY